mmetsp:Transcript_5392/g.12804  ORF Transcript_5392/g.12804 Transcript_5392/m.12804 type:complete len:247 (-) Transcript_5392:1376-2116(-)
MVTITPVDENNKDIFDIETLLGPTLIKDIKGSPVPTAKDALKSNKSGMVALYFSASWCPPCQRFTPILIDFYNAAKEADCGFDIVFVSSDRGSEEFEGYYGKMPWLSIPPIQGSAAIKQKLAETLGVSAIPALAILDTKTGEFIIGGEARDHVVAAAGDKEKVVATINAWKEGPRYPLSEGSKMMDMGAGSKNHFFRFLSFLAKNPMIIFGIIYIYKWTQRKMVEMGFDDDGSTPPVIEDAEDSEF